MFDYCIEAQPKELTVAKILKAKEIFALQELREWHETVVILKFYYGWIP